MSGASVDQTANRYIREIVHMHESPPPVAVRYFYTSLLAIDDPLSPIPPPATGSAAPRQPPRPFSAFDNETLDRAWLELRRKILRYHEEQSHEKAKVYETKKTPASSKASDTVHIGAKGRDVPLQDTVRENPDRRHTYTEGLRQTRFGSASRDNALGNQSTESDLQGSSKSILSGSLKTHDAHRTHGDTEGTMTTRNPFIRAPSRPEVPSSSARSSTRPNMQENDSYNWGEDFEVDQDQATTTAEQMVPKIDFSSPTTKVPVGVSRLHNVQLSADAIRMEPIYWSPVNDIAPIIRGTWFYKESMLPVEADVSNMLEAGYISLQPWTQTWVDELNSAVEVGAAGEMKIVQRLWPEKPKKAESRPGTSREAGSTQNNLNELPKSPEEERKVVLENACDMIDISSGPDGPDNKCIGTTFFGRDGKKRNYLDAGVIYANERDAYILRPSLQPSDYYGRRPLANYIRKGRHIGVEVCRGFSQEIWDKLHPVKKSPIATKAYEGVSSAQAGVPPSQRQYQDEELAQSERPEVTDLVLVIHGIGQKLSERVESFHFTHAINALRREVNVELGTDAVKSHLRPQLGGIMVLPVNWRLRLSFEDGGYRDEEEESTLNQYSLKDITPETLPSVRNIISDVMLDVPYYLSPEHNPKMVEACITEANRIYRLWCLNNPGFAQHGRVHLIAHSLGSVMAVDILSQQPTYVDRHFSDSNTPESELPKSYFAFDTRSLFLCGSPVGFFLLLKKANLLPRKDRKKTGGDGYSNPGVAGEVGTYGCLAVDNVYNIVNPYDPVAYRVNATVDVTYSESLRQAFVPTATTSWLSFSPLNPFGRNNTTATGTKKPVVSRLPSNVELETHNFTREEIAEKRAYLLNDNGQIDWFLKYGGGALEIQYLTMLGAHSSYWISKDFIRFVVVEVGRPEGKKGTVPTCRAVKKKGLDAATTAATSSTTHSAGIGAA